jgi:excisionase family DNA binding protein
MIIMTTSDFDGALTVNQFCELYKIGRTYLYAQVKTGRLQVKKAGTKTLISRAEGRRWFAALSSDVLPKQRDPAPVLERGGV